MSELPAVYEKAMTFQETMTLGEVLAKSGYFQDAKSASQAIVKILAGRELGIEPIASMSGIAIVKGKPTIGASLMAALVKRSGKYDYRILTLTDSECEIEFYQTGKPLNPTSKFSLQDATKAGLKGDNWKHYPRNMLFARAMSNGCRWHCPDIFAGQTVYTPEELEEAAAKPNETVTISTEKPEDIDAGLSDSRKTLEARIREAGIDREEFKLFLSETPSTTDPDSPKMLIQKGDRLSMNDLSGILVHKLTHNGEWWARAQDAFRGWQGEKQANCLEETLTPIATTGEGLDDGTALQLAADDPWAAHNEGIDEDDPGFIQEPEQNDKEYRQEYDHIKKQTFPGETE